VSYKEGKKVSQCLKLLSCHDGGDGIDDGGEKWW
jgi:hypothetical protein